MAVQQRLMQQVEDLKQLVDLIENPQAIISAHEEARRQVALTEAEIARVAEIRKFIVEHESMLKDMEDRELDVVKSMADFEKYKSAFMLEVNEKSDDLNKRQLLLVSRENDLSAMERGQKETALALDIRTKQIDKDFQNMMGKLDSQAALYDRQRIANETEAKRLRELRDSLEAKAAKFLEAAQF
jgi:hypothetical protein